MTIPKYEIKRSKDDAVYQYLIDHARPTHHGFRVSFFLNGRADWDSRVRSRMNGKYRQEESYIGEVAQRLEAEFHIMQKNARNIGNVCQRISSSGSLKERIYLWLYRFTRNALFK